LRSPFGCRSMRHPVFVWRLRSALSASSYILYICIPGMKMDCHDNLPPELLLSWTPEALDTIHDAGYWRNIISHTHGVDILSIHEMESNEEVWNDWLDCDNEYARGDRTTIEAGGCKYLNFIAAVLRRQ